MYRSIKFTADRLNTSIITTVFITGMRSKQSATLNSPTEDAQQDTTMNLDHIKYLMSVPELSDQLEQSSSAFSANPDRHVTNLDLEIILEVSQPLRGQIYQNYRETMNI